MRYPRLFTIGAVLLLLGVSGFTNGPPSIGVSKIVVIVMENKEYNQIIGSPAAPYINSLASQYTLLTNYFAVTHVSLADYLTITGGSTFGITENCNDCFINAANLGDQLEKAGLSWKTYQESMPSPCFLGDAYPYMQKHDGFIYYNDIKDNGPRCNAHVVPFSQLSSDMNSGKLPNFSLITPNMCSDMHDCSIATGDAWLARQVPAILSHLGPTGIVVITFDEGTTNAGCCFVAHGGHIVTLIAGPGAKLNNKINTAVDAYSLLRLVEDNWGLSRLLYAGCVCTPAIVGWRR
jgi:hypothetical protein